MLNLMLKEILRIRNLFSLGYVWTSWSRENINNNNKFKFVQHKKLVKMSFAKFQDIINTKENMRFAKKLFYNLTFRLHGEAMVVDN